jgi:alkylated DNA repair dioxygenase AlkB
MSKSQESDGMVVALEGPSRYDFAHEVPPVSASRVSLTWRWFDEEFLQQLQQREANLRKKRGDLDGGDF